MVAIGKVSEKSRSPGRSGLDKATEQEKQLTERYARQIQLEMLGRNGDAAHHLVDRGLAALDPPSTDEIYGRALASILDTRSANALEMHLNAVTVGDALQLTTAQLYSVPNFGPTSVVALYAAIARAAFAKVDELTKPERRFRASNN